MVNVPMGVWIDENGQIVRSAEVAYSKHQVVMKQSIGDDRYAAGVRDWVEKGAQSAYVLAPERLKEKLTGRTPEQRMADAEFKLGAYFAEKGKRDLAAKHWHESQRLNPDCWNYHRQEWSYDKSKEMANWLAKVRGLGSKPYYEPADFSQLEANPGEAR